MSLFRFRFTIAQFGNIVFVLALLFATVSALPMKNPAPLVLLLPGLLLFVPQPFRWLVLIGCGLAYFTWFYIYPDPEAETIGVLAFFMGAFLAAVSSLIATSSWGAKKGEGEERGHK